MQPTSAVLVAFGASGRLSKLPGGRGTEWRAGNLTLKPVDLLAEELQWLDQVARRHCEEAGVRVSLPIRSRSGLLAVDGWIAFPHLAGEHRPRRWIEIASIAREFAALFAGARRPDFIDARANPWASADRFAWGEDSSSEIFAAPHVVELVAARTPITASEGIVHGDLTGNVLFDPDEAPAVIDVTAYWRPTEYSVAIIAVDAICFEGAPLSLLHDMSVAAEFPQYLVRALLLRIVTDWLRDEPHAAYDAYSPLVHHVLSLIAHRA